MVTLLTIVTIFSAVGSASAQSISASPNPCFIGEGEFNCATTVNWTPSNAYDLWVWVPASGFSSIVATGAVGSVSLPWIGTNEAIFQLKNGGSGQIFASTSALAVRPFLSASPNPCTIQFGSWNCSSIVSWLPSEVYNLWVTVPSTGFTSVVAAGSQGSVNLPWIASAESIFQLKDVTSGKVYNTISLSGVNALAPPSCSTISVNTSTVSVGGSVTATANCVGSIQGYSWSAAAGVQAPGNVQSAVIGPFNSAGTYAISVAATNASGQSNTVTTQITVQSPAISCTSAFAGANIIEVGNSVTIGANCSGNGLTYYWSVMPTNSPALPPGIASALVGPFQAVGTYVFSVYVGNGTQSSNTVSIQVQVTPRTCNAFNEATLSACVDKLKNNSSDHVRITQSFTCSSNLSCGNTLEVNALTPRSIPIEIYGADQSITITRFSAAAAPVFSLVGDPRVAGGSPTTIGQPILGAKRIANITIKSLRILDSQNILDIGCTSVPLPSAGTNSPLAIYSASNIVLSSLVVESCGFALIEIGSGDSITIDSSSFRGGRLYGIFFPPYKYGDYGTEYTSQQFVHSNIRITNNTIRQSAANALFLGGINNGLIQGNLLLGNHRENPFPIDPNNPAIGSYPGGQLVIEAGTTNTVVTGNIIRDTKPGTQAVGIEFAPTVSQAKISNISITQNTIYNIGSEAIAFDCLQGAIPAMPNCVFPGAFPKPSAPENIFVTNNIFYNTFLDFPSNLSAPRVVKLPLDYRFNSIEIDNNRKRSTNPSLVRRA